MSVTQDILYLGKRKSAHDGKVADILLDIGSQHNFVVGQGQSSDRLFAFGAMAFFNNVLAHDLCGRQWYVFFIEDHALFFCQLCAAVTEVNWVRDSFRDVLVFRYRSFV